MNQIQRNQIFGGKKWYVRIKRNIDVDNILGAYIT